jgi:4-amino-4-deoxychorismate lyase
MNEIKNSEGFQYGYGVFETIKVYKDELLYLKDHFERLGNSLLTLNMPRISFQEFSRVLEDAKANSKDDVIKIICYLDGHQTKMLVNSRENTYKLSDYLQGYTMKKSPYIKHSSNFLLQHKTLNYLSTIFEKRCNEDSTCHECLHFNEKDFITECLFSNLFFVKNNCVFTPHVSNGLLPGIQRKNVLKTLKKLGISFEIGYYKEEALLEADEVFLTNSVINIMPVFKYEDRIYDLNQNKVTKILMEVFNNGLL